MLVKKKPVIKILDRNGETWIFKPFYKDENLCPCSLCILKDPNHLIMYGEDGCALKYMYKTIWTGSAYSNICRKFDTSRFYYIMRETKDCVN